jgi:hypothetical protein
MEEIQAKSRSRKNQNVRFWILKYPVLDTGVSGFTRTDRVRVGFEIQFFRKDLHVQIKELYLIAYINIRHGRL